MFLEALLAFELYLREMQAKLEHPKELTFETREAEFVPTIRLGSTNSLTYTIRFKGGRINRRHRMGGLELNRMDNEQKNR
jgi:hypothetical protein